MMTISHHRCERLVVHASKCAKPGLRASEKLNRTLHRSGRPQSKQPKPQRAKQQARQRQPAEESKLAAASTRIQRIEAQRIAQRVAEALGNTPPQDHLQPFYKACAAANEARSSTPQTRGRGAKHAQRATLRQQFRATFLAALDAELAAEWEETQSRLQQSSGAELQRAGLCIQGLAARQDSSVFKYVDYIVDYIPFNDVNLVTTP